MTRRDLLARAHHAALTYLDDLSARKVRAQASAQELRNALGGALPEHAEPCLDVLERLIASVEPGLVHTAGPRYFGFVVGGSLPIAVAADWLTSAWDQNAFGYALSPAASVVEEIVAAWLLELLGLPAAAGLGFVTGGQMASFSCLCAARDEVLRRAGHDVEQLGLHGASLRVFVGAEGHSTIHTALRMLGIGRAQVIAVEADAQGRMRADALRAALTAHAGPSIVCAQAGNVNSGAFDPFEDIVSAAHARGAWVHVDGAFGLWAAVVPTLRAQLRGVERADSWAVDAHKWLNVPYDSGFAIVADAGALRAAVRTQPAAYLVRERGERDGSDWAPESSRRARAFVIYAALRSLGRSGLSELIERNCRQARQLAERLARDAGATIVNDVVLNQVLVRFGLPGADPAREDALMRAVVQRVQEDGVCWVGPTVYRGRVTMRIALSNWSTTDADIERSAAAISDALRVVREQVRHDAG